MVVFGYAAVGLFVFDWWKCVCSKMFLLESNVEKQLWINREVENTGLLAFYIEIFIALKSQTVGRNILRKRAFSDMIITVL